MHAIFICFYLLIVSVIILKTTGIILIIKGFINKNQKQWAKGFYIVALACILLVTALALGIHSCPKFMKCKRECREEWMMKGDSCKMEHGDMHCGDMMQKCCGHEKMSNCCGHEKMGNCCGHEKMDSTACAKKMEMCKEHK